MRITCFSYQTVCPVADAKIPDKGVRKGEEE